MNTDVRKLKTIIKLCLDHNITSLTIKDLQISFGTPPVQKIETAPSEDWVESLNKNKKEIDEELLYFSSGSH